MYFQRYVVLLLFFGSMVFLWASDYVMESAYQPQVQNGLRQRIVEPINWTTVLPNIRPMEDYLATHDTSILMYNRVPKTGSSSMRTMLINLAKVGDQPSKLKGCLGWLSLSV